MLINNIPIDIFPHFNYLGIILDEHLSWKAIVAMVTGKIEKNSGISVQFVVSGNFENIYRQYVCRCILRIIYMFS